MNWTPRPFPFAYLQNEDTCISLIEERRHSLSMLRHFYYKHFSQKTISHPGTKAVYLCHPFGFYAYGHLHDSLQRLFSIRDILEDSSLKFAVSRYDQICDFKEHLSILVGRPIEADDLILVGGSEIHLFDQLIVPYSPAMPTSYTPDTYRWIFQAYTDYFGLNSYNVDPALRIYLSRNHVKPGSRSVVNEAEVLNCLTAHGFRALDGTESLEDIVRSFYMASTIIGPHGSLFANTIYCRKKTRIFEFCPANRVDFSFKNKYKLSAGYEHILVDSDSNFNIQIGVHTLRGILKDISA